MNTKFDIGHPTTFHVSIQQFKHEAKVFFDLLDTSTDSQSENGYKALALLFLGLDEATSDQQLYEAQMILDIAQQKLIEHVLSLDTSS